jgi:hypothetical protein
MAEELTVRLTGTVPLLMHNERMANPLDPAQQATRPLAKKRGKTDDDYLNLSFLEFKGGLYHDDEDGPYIPNSWLHATIKNAAKITRKGTDVSRALRIPGIYSPLRYEGPRDVDGLWKGGFFDRRMVGNQKARVLRTRPRFDVWQVDFVVSYEESTFDRRQVKEIIDTAGAMTGLGDYRPNFGRFTAEFLN